MLEITSSILNADRRKRFAQHLHQSLPRACSCLAHRTLDLAERFFYRVEVRRVGGQVDQLATRSFEPSTAIVSPIPPRRVIEAKRVVFLPRFRGTSRRTHSPFGE